MEEWFWQMASTLLAVGKLLVDTNVFSFGKYFVAIKHVAQMKILTNLTDWQLMQNRNDKRLGSFFVSSFFLVWFWIHFQNKFPQAKQIYNVYSTKDWDFFLLFIQWTEWRTQ